MVPWIKLIVDVYSKQSHFCCFFIGEVIVAKVQSMQIWGLSRRLPEFYIYELQIYRNTAPDNIRELYWINYSVERVFKTSKFFLQNQLLFNVTFQKQSFSNDIENHFWQVIKLLETNDDVIFFYGWIHPIIHIYLCL